MRIRLLSILILPIGLIACSENTIVDDTGKVRTKSSPAADTKISTLEPQEHCEAIIASVRDAGFDGEEAWVTCDAEHAYIHSDSYPSHEMMTGIVGTNEQIPIPAPGYYAPVRFNPSFTGTPQTRDSSLAVAVNGTPIFDYSAGGELSVEHLYYHYPHLDTLLIQQLDKCGGHVGRGDDYHYHELPRCMIEQMDNKDDNPIIGWGFDGFPLYGNNNPDGSIIEPGTLDVCNGQLDPIFGYRYHTSDEPPYIIQCLAGEVGDLSAIPTIGFDRPIGIPVLVDNLVFTHDGQGDGLLTYEHEGENYYIRSQKTDSPECFNVEWKTVTNGGIVESGEYCHVIRSGAPPARPPGERPEGEGNGPRPDNAPGGNGPRPEQPQGS